MELFDVAFNAASIKDMLFFNIKSVLEYPTLEKLKEANEPMYNRWEYISDEKFGDVDKPRTRIYMDNAIYYPEFCKIAAISFGSIDFVDGKIVRSFKGIKNNDEAVNIEAFMSALHQESSDGKNSSPESYKMLCGYNISAYEIPLLIKRFLVHSHKFEKKTLPYILKKHLSSKPWDSTAIDVNNIWKFNGVNSSSLMLISDFLNLKRKVDLMDAKSLSEYYWSNIDINQEETLDFMSLQSLTQLNLIVQFINFIRKF